MEIKNVKTEEITPYENNPRRNEKAVEAVKISIEEYGFRVPVILTKEKVLVCGHTRLKAAKLMGLTEIPAIFVEDLTKEQIKAFRIADNKVSEASTWDFEKLEAELEEIDINEFIERYFPEKTEQNSNTESFKSQEIELGEFNDEKFEYECPCCGFRFNKT